MADFIQGVLGSAQAQTFARNDITLAIRNWYINLNPLITRLGYVPLDRVSFDMVSSKYRARSTTLITTAISSGATTTITVADNTFLMMHDILEWTDATTGVAERFQIAADPNTNGTGLTVVRALSGTTAATNVPTTSVIKLIGNSRLGDEINQKGLSVGGVSRTNYAQTFQFPVEVGGSAESTRAAIMPGGLASPYNYNQTMQLQNMLNDIEYTLMYGIAQAPTDGSVTAKANGLRQILTTNRVTAPTNGAAYTLGDLIRDTIGLAQAGGGEPDLMIVSTNFTAGLSLWGNAVQRVNVGETRLGVAINVIEAPFLNGVTLVTSPLLEPFTAIAITSSEVYIRNKRDPFFQPRGLRGDRWEGDWLAELSIEVANEPHHAWLEGVTAFSAS